MSGSAADRLREVMTAITEKVLQSTLDHGTFGMDVLDRLHERLEPTTCDCCGECCFSISFYSLEYHRIIRFLAECFGAAETRRILYRALHDDSRMVRTGETPGEYRLRCVFLDQDSRRCRIYPVRPFMCRVFGQGLDDERECPRVEGGGRVGRDFLESLCIPVAEASERIPVETPGGTDLIDFFPFEFWLRRYVQGTRPAVDWYRGSFFFVKYLAEKKRSAT